MPPEPIPAPTEPMVTVRSAGARYAQEVTVGEHRLTADEPAALGGGDRGPNPYELLLASLGTCTSMTLQMYAQRKQWPLEGVTVRLRIDRIHAADCADCEAIEGKVDRIDREIELAGPLDDEQRAALLAIADKCPVHRTLKGEISIRTKAR
jgi:putative redox protein